MIIRLNTTFPNYIGTLTTWSISWRGDGYTYDGELPRSVKKNEAFNITVKVASGYTYDSVPITIKMGDTDIPESAISRNSAGTITINIASVTGKLVITIGEVASGGGSEEGGSGSGGNVALTLTDYKSYIGCIAGSTNTIQGTGAAGSTATGNMYLQVPLADFSNPSSVTVTADSGIKAYFTFFSRKVVADDTSKTPPYASGITAQTILDAGTSSTVSIPSGATHMYILLTNGTGGNLRPKSVVFHNATFVSNSDPASGSSGGGSNVTQTTEQVFGVYWTLGQTISSSGSVGSQPTYALSADIARPSGKNLKYTPYSGEPIWMVIGLWNGDTWIERKTFDPAIVTSATTITLDSNVTKIRIGYGRTSTSEKNMDLATLKNLQLEWV